MPAIRNQHASQHAPTGQPSHGDATRANMAADEPDQTAIVPIYTGRHLWSGKRPTEPLPPGTICAPEVAYEELPLPNGDRAKLPPCTVRWQFTGAFNLNRDEGIARGSFRVQVRQALTAKKVANVACTISFPRGTGRQKLVEITIAPDVLAALADVKLVFNGSTLQRLFVGPALPNTAMVVDIRGVPLSVSRLATARYIALGYSNQLPQRPHATRRHNQHGGSRLIPPPVPMAASTQPESMPFLATSNWVTNCELHYVGRLAWCTTCKADTANFHLFDLCPRRRFYNCRGRVRYSSTITIATWNCASLQPPDRIAALHDPSNDLGKADIVLLQEMRIAAPASLPLLNPFVSLHHPVRPRAHQAVLGKDAGILIRNTRWEVEATEHHDHCTYARVHIPPSGPALGNGIRLHIWSIHAPPSHVPQAQFWNDDVPQLSRLDASSIPTDSAGIVGADWNAIESEAFDRFPAGGSTPRVPHGLLNQAGLIDVFRTLHPTGTAFTRFHKVDNAIVSTRRLDGVSVTHNLVPHLKSVETRPSLSDHSSVTVRIGTSHARTDLGPGAWRLHRDAHRQPGFALRISQFASQQPEHLNRAPVDTFFAFAERMRATAANISTTQSQNGHKREFHRQEVLRQLATLDIRHGDKTRAQFLRLLTQLHHLDSARADKTVADARSLQEIDMYQPTSWIIPRLESRSFATTPDLVDDRGTHTEPHAKLRAIHRFYTTLFTPRHRDMLSEEAAAVLHGSVTHRISSATRHHLEAPFTVSELREALQRAPDTSAPGMDGLTFPLIRAAGGVFVERISRLGNALLRGHRLPVGEPMLRGVLLPKKGDLSSLSNYRPLSIANTAFRLLGGAVSKRLQAAASEVVHSAQTGFITGRSSASNVITVALLQHAVKFGHITENLWILNLDQQNAYDRVRHEWLLACLQAYGFGPRFLTYITEVYRHPSVRQSAEGHFTEPIFLQCGILQGDPMSCLLYNLSLQPLLDHARGRHHAGTTLQWDTTAPLLVSSLAFADDILLVVNNRRDLSNFIDSLGLYELASNAQVNEEKSQAFFFANGPTPDDQIDESDIPYPTLGESMTEIIHLGYPIRLDGGIPQTNIDRRLAGLKSKVNVLATTKTTLLARARICNSFLLAKLWHAFRLCPLPKFLQRDINAIIHPFLFLGRRNWIRFEYVIVPRHLGGLDVISTHHMTITLLGKELAALLTGTDRLATQFCAALQEFLWSEYGAIPAHFVIRHGQPWLQMNNVLLAQKLFMHRAVYTLCQLQLSVAPDWESISVPELLSLPFYNDMYCFTFPSVSQTTLNTWERNGFRVWGDILWYNPDVHGRSQRVHPSSTPRCWPLVPPSASGVQNNYVPTRGHPDTSTPFGRAAGFRIASFWKDMWNNIHPPVSIKLKDIGRHYPLHPDHSTSTMNPRPHDRPYVIDTVGLPFPWRFVTLAGRPAAQYTVKQARSFLGRTDPIVPDWQFESTTAQWRDVWIRHLDQTLVTSEAQSDIFLFLHRRPWLAQKPRMDRRLPNYADLDNIAINPRDNMRNHELVTDPDVPFNDAYEAEHVFGVTRCMLCEGPMDSAAHGFIDCERIQTLVWRAIMPTLHKLTGSRVLDLRNVVLGWPELKMPPLARHHHSHPVSQTLGCHYGGTK
ncbi:related to Retrovirus-related POL polyprotein [Ustilago sp. UG-2017b]|nr:related to Retrovirus-related POL polyprotein [Ustilago sp. UG-2017b]